MQFFRLSLPRTKQRLFYVTTAVALFCAFLIVFSVLLLLWQVSVPVIAGLVGGLILLMLFTRTKLFEKLQNDVVGHKSHSLLLAICLVLVIIWKPNIELILATALFFSFLFYRWNNLIIIALALISLFSSLVLLLLNLGQAAEKFATYAFWFFAIALILHLVEIFRDNPASLSLQKLGKLPKKTKAASAK